MRVPLVLVLALAMLLDAIRRDPALASDPRAIDELVREADAAPPSPERVDAWVLAAEAYAERLGRPEEAERLYRAIVAAPEADDVLRGKARRDLVTVLVARGDLEAAADAARGGDPALAAEVRRLIVRRWLHFTSIGVLAAVALMFARAVAKRRPRGALRGAKVALAFAAWVGLGGALLVSRYEDADATPFLVLGAAIVPVLFVARAWSLAGSPSRAARVSRAVACAGAALAAAFLVMEATAP